MKIEFKFEIDEKVSVPGLGQNGIVSMCGVDSGGIQYYVQMPAGGQWVKEIHLEKSKEGA